MAGKKIGAEDGARTRDLILGKDVLYQLSYFRPLRTLRAGQRVPTTVAGAEGQNRTDDTSIFSAVLYLLSYLGASKHVNNSSAQCQVECLYNWRHTTSHMHWQFCCHIPEHSAM